MFLLIFLFLSHFAHSTPLEKRSPSDDNFASAALLNKCSYPLYVRSIDSVGPSVSKVAYSTNDTVIPEIEHDNTKLYTLSPGESHNELLRWLRSGGTALKVSKFPDSSKIVQFDTLTLTTSSPA
ncbi:hypothetical protein M501DRAFT_1061013 [Patellaria atrata CBS 101060]|uniref:Uncharacterized protein n=1 Tax=Patellaria atrata CBS 101060 TaxID=1346257 RepID=A0A9P4S581_9PEZI|nr:hypothetical protein M501DRAFT_1061013 [Patellaria atrata CBS 101060]